MKAKRHLGQHFLTDPRILNRIADALGASPGDRVLEIGPGRGGLTRVLLERGLRVTAVERDPDLTPSLRAEFPQLTLVEGDALRLDWAAAVGARPGEAWWVAGNIPYQITSPLIDKALEPPRPVRIVYLVQREVAERLAAEPGTPAYGALTVGVRVLAGVQRLFAVPAGAFQPRPRVESAVVRIEPLRVPLVTDAELSQFRRLVAGLFGARRKQLIRALRTIGLSLEDARRAAVALGVEGTRRAETLAPREFVALHRYLVDGRGDSA